MAMWAEKENLNPCRRTEKKKNSSATKKKKKKQSKRQPKNPSPFFVIGIHPSIFNNVYLLHKPFQRAC